MKIYLAARWARRDEISAIADRIRLHGVDVCSTWHDVDSQSVDGYSDVGDAARAAWAERILREIETAEALVLFAEQGDQGSTCTRIAEFGVAVGLGKRVVIVGEPFNLFGHAMRVECVPDLDALIAWVVDRYAHRLCNVPYVAKSLGVTRQAVARWCRTGEVRAVRSTEYPNAGDWLIPADEIERMRVQLRKRNVLTSELQEAARG